MNSTQGLQGVSSNTITAAAEARRAAQAKPQTGNAEFQIANAPVAETENRVDLDRYENAGEKGARQIQTEHTAELEAPVPERKGIDLMA